GEKAPRHGDRDQAVERPALLSREFGPAAGGGVQAEEDGRGCDQGTDRALSPGRAEGRGQVLQSPLDAEPCCGSSPEGGRGMSKKHPKPVKTLPEMKSVQKVRASQKPGKPTGKTTEPVEHFKRYSNNLSMLMRDYDWSPVAELAQDLARAIKSRAQLFICGNGGSAGEPPHPATRFFFTGAPPPGRAPPVPPAPANPP